MNCYYEGANLVVHGEAELVSVFILLLLSLLDLELSSTRQVVTQPANKHDYTLST